MRRVIPAAVVLLAGLVAPRLALGHAELVSSVPDDGATVQGPDVEVVLAFSERLSDGSKADVLGPDGTVVITLAPDDASPTTMSGAAPLEAGDYTIQWMSVADDGDILRGEITFEVLAPPTEEPSPSPAPSLSAAPSPSPSPSASPEASATPTASPPPNGGDGGDRAVIIPIVVALVFVAAAAWWLLRRRPIR